MSFVRVRIIGADTRHEARDIAGVDPRFCHPLGRYAQNPYDRLSPLQPSRPILTKKKLSSIAGIGHNVSFSLHSRQLYFTDLWAGEYQEVHALVSRPAATDLLVGLSRIAIVRKRYDDGKERDDSEHTINEVLLQAQHETAATHPTWQTVAAIAVHDKSSQQYGFVDPEFLDDSACRSAEVLEQESAMFLCRLVSRASISL